MVLLKSPENNAFLAVSGSLLEDSNSALQFPAQAQWNTKLKKNGEGGLHEKIELTLQKMDAG